MTTFTTSFRPSLNKEGYAKCTYIGYEIKEGKRKDNDETWSLLSINFEVMGVTRGISQKVSITCGFTYSEDNTLGKTLKVFGFKPPTNKTVTDEDGFEVTQVEEDENGFETSDEIDLGIEEFLKKVEVKIFIAKINKATEGKKKGFWEIDVDTLQPFVKMSK